MLDYHTTYAHFADALQAQGVDVRAVKDALKQQRIEMPSWGYANSGTRFKTFPWPGAGRTTRKKLDDAAMVRRMTGITTEGALPVMPWDKPENSDYAAMRQYAEGQGIWIGAVNSSVFQDDVYRRESLGHPNSAIREQVIDHLAACCTVRLFAALQPLRFTHESCGALNRSCTLHSLTKGKH